MTEHSAAAVDDTARPARRRNTLGTQSALKPIEPHARDREPLPQLLTVNEAAALLRTSRKAIYTMVERRQLPGLMRIGRRVLFDAAELVDWLRQKRASSPQE